MVAAPRLPMTADEYSKWRSMLWSQRGPNVATPTYDSLLPCYRQALTRSERLARGGELAEPAEPAGGTIASAPPPAAATVAAPMRVNTSLTPCDSPARRKLVVETLLAGVAAGAEEPFYVVDLQVATERLALWRALLPDIEPHYAAKCNGDPALLLTLAHGGCGFDCASKAEIEEVLALGVPASRLLYANPIKQPSHLRFAAKVGVNLTVFDGEAELRKIAELHPSSDLLLRVAVDDSQAQCVLSNKYGALPSDTDRLLEVAAELGLRVAGVSFHVGSGSSSGDAFRDAVARAAAIFQQSAARGCPMSILDVGGGFPGVDGPDVSFAAMATSLREAISHHFPKEWGVRYIAEPGRFFAANTHTLATSVIGKKVLVAPSGASVATAGTSQSAATAAVGAPAHKDACPAVDIADGGGADAAATEVQSRVNYYINDGLYGSFNCVLYDHASPECFVLPTKEAPKLPADPSAPVCNVWGPTCDGIDCVLADTRLPELPVGAWLYFPSMGAYTCCAGSNFNGMSLPDLVYLQAKGEARPQSPTTAGAQMVAQMRAEGISPSPWSASSGAADKL